MTDQTQYYLNCQIGHEWYGICTENVLKVFHLVALTELPDATPDVLGLMTLPDQVVPVLDLRKRFGLHNAPYRLDTPIIVVDTLQETLGLVVDTVDNIEPVSDTQKTVNNKVESPYIMGVARLPERLLLLLDVSRLRINPQNVAVK